jgi:hypothetical protein
MKNQPQSPQPRTLNILKYPIFEIGGTHPSCGPLIVRISDARHFTTYVGMAEFLNLRSMEQTI